MRNEDCWSWLSMQKMLQYLRRPPFIDIICCQTKNNLRAPNGRTRKLGMNLSRWARLCPQSKVSPFSRVQVIIFEV